MCCHWTKYASVIWTQPNFAKLCAYVWCTCSKQSKPKGRMSNKHCELQWPRVPNYSATVLTSMWKMHSELTKTEKRQNNGPGHVALAAQKEAAEDKQKLFNSCSVVVQVQQNVQVYFSAVIFFLHVEHSKVSISYWFDSLTGKKTHTHTHTHTQTHTHTHTHKHTPQHLILKDQGSHITLLIPMK